LLAANGSNGAAPVITAAIVAGFRVYPQWIAAGLRRSPRADDPADERPKKHTLGSIAAERAAGGAAAPKALAQLRPQRAAAAIHDAGARKLRSTACRFGRWRGIVQNEKNPLRINAFAQAHSRPADQRAAARASALCRQQCA